MRQWCRNTLAHVSKFNIHMLQPTVATIQSPLFCERICAEIKISENFYPARRAAPRRDPTV